MTINCVIRVCKAVKKLFCLLLFLAYVIDLDQGVQTTAYRPMWPSKGFECDLCKRFSRFFSYFTKFLIVYFIMHEINEFQFVIEF